MATISAALVKELRESTGAGMMDCKTALTENDANFEAAVDWLRKKGLSKAAKKAGRVAAEGLVAALVEGGKGVVTEVNSETDFVARNADFQTLVKNVAQTALKTGKTEVEELNAQAYPGGGTVAEAVTTAIANIGENLTLRRAAELSVSDGVVGRYVHTQISDGLGKIAVIVALESKGDKEVLATLARQLSMHVASANPLALTAEEIDAATIEREKNLLREKNAGKPEKVMEKIIEFGAQDVLQGSAAARAGLEPPRPRRQDRRPGRQGDRGQGRRADRHQGLQALCAGRRHREADRGFRCGSRGCGQGLSGVGVVSAGAPSPTLLRFAIAQS